MQKVHYILASSVMAHFGRASDLWVSSLQVQVLAGKATLGKLFTPMCLCHQAV